MQEHRVGVTVGARSGAVASTVKTAEPVRDLALDVLRDPLERDRGLDFLEQETARQAWPLCLPLRRSERRLRPVEP